MYVDYPTLEDAVSKSGPGETNLQQTLSTSSNNIQLAPSSGKTFSYLAIFNILIDIYFRLSDQSGHPFKQNSIGCFKW